MKNPRFNIDFLDSSIFKNSVIIFGMCLSLFTITSFDSISSLAQSQDQAVYQEQQIDAKCIQPETSDLSDASKKENSQKTPHNFIASYLLEESSAKKEEAEPQEEIKIISQLLKLNKRIITSAIRFL